MPDLMYRKPARWKPGGLFHIRNIRTGRSPWSNDGDGHSLAGVAADGVAHHPRVIAPRRIARQALSNPPQYHDA
ncbi:hypothetical protein [Burkholderia anthina]|uniref:hypothetical protein n=1 Tax=Burkholderia anthina TaxID=179879 RepID=UPI0015885F43|nr:hypothetical protein [Burkholderia anthina]